VTAQAVEFDPLRDKSYRATRLGGDVADWLAWFELGGAAPRTLDQYESDLARGCKMFPLTPLGQWGERELLHVAKSFGPKERKPRMAAYRSFFKWARMSRRIDHNPCEILPSFKQPRKRVFDVFTDAEIAALTGLPDRDGTLMQMMFDAGPRRGDCCAFRFRHWRSDATPEAPYGVLVFLGGKGGKDRVVPSTEAVARKLSELQILDGLGRDSYLWYMRPGGRAKILRERPLGTASFNKWWHRSLDDAGVRHREPKMARHTFATRYLRNRGRLETLRLLMGHESIQTTSDLYGHLDMRDAALDMGLIQEPERA
jgi:integrase